MPFLHPPFPNIGYPTSSLLRIVLSLSFVLLLQACSENTSWEKYQDAGEKAYEQHRYADSEKMFLTALKEAQTRQLDNAHLARTTKSLGDLYYGQGKLAEAEPFYRQALATREKTWGTDHPDLVSILTNLAAIYDKQGKLGQAEPLYQRALAASEKASGIEQPQANTIIKNLAKSYNAQGKNKEAEGLYRRVLERR